MRSVLAGLGEIRSLVSSSVKILALTATASRKLCMDVGQMLGLRNELIISISLSKPNIIYAVQQFTTIPGTFASMLSQLKREISQFPRTISLLQTL